MKALYITIITLFTISLSAQQDEAAEPYLNNISNMLKAEKTLLLSFEYQRDDLQAETSLTGTGKTILQGEKYKTEIDETAIIWFDGEKQYSFNKEIEEVYVSKLSPDNKESLFSDPINLLKNYKEVFKYRFIGDAVIESTNVKEVQLYPKELGGPYALIKLYFDISSGDLNAIHIRQKDGILYTMILAELTTIPNPNEDFFKFIQSDFPNAEVIELLD